MSIYPFRLANDTTNDADELMELLDVVDAILDGGIGPENLADDFALDSDKLTENDVEIHISLPIVVTAAMTTGYKGYHTLVAGDYTFTHAYLTTQLAGAGIPTGTGTLTVKSGVYTAGAFVVANTIVSTRTFYSATPTATSVDITSLIGTVAFTGPITIVLSIDAVPSINPPTSGFMELTLVFTRKLQ